MGEPKETRLDVIRNMMSTYGIEHGSKVFISLWDLSANINNTWNSEHFVNVKKFDSNSDWGFSLPNHREHELFRAIRSAVKGTNIELRKSYYNKSEYLVVEQ